MNNLYISAFINHLNDDYLKKCVDLGIETIFTSFHIPEQTLTKSIIEQHINKINKIGFKKIIADISHKTFEITKPNELQQLGINDLRIDYGLSIKEIIELINNNFTIYFNASTITSKDMEELINNKIDKNKIIFIHNYYPMVNTALSKNFIAKQNQLIYSNGFTSIGGFIAGTIEKRLPLELGLPTIEKTRDLKEFDAFQIAKNYFNFTIVGDNQADVRELEKILNQNNDVVELKLSNFDSESIPLELNKLLFGDVLNIRYDSGEDMYRIFETRGYASINKFDIKPNIKNGLIGDLIIFNNNSKRYVGEICILRRSIKNNGFFNIIGKISNFNEFDLDKIKLKNK